MDRSRKNTEQNKKQIEHQDATDIIFKPHSFSIVFGEEKEIMFHLIS